MMKWPLLCDIYTETEADFVTGGCEAPTEIGPRKVPSYCPGGKIAIYLLLMPSTGLCHVL